LKFTVDTNVLVDVLRNPADEEAFGVFLGRFSKLTYLSAVVVLELRAGARTPRQVDLLDREVIGRFERAGRIFAPSVGAFRTAGELLARLAVREGWTAAGDPSLVRDALLAASCRESRMTLVTRDRDFGRFRDGLRGWQFVRPWPEILQ
jgi:predicted nucleic acid-binding protein